MQAEEDAAALANEGQPAVTLTGLESGLQGLHVGMAGHSGDGASLGLPARVPSSAALDSNGQQSVSFPLVDLHA